MFKSSLFGKSVGYEALQNRFKASKEKLKEKHLAPKTKAAVVGALKRSATREDFRGNLHRRGIDVIFRENVEGRIYGVTFIDHNNGCVVNGSRLGKELSANAVAEWFDRPHPELSDSVQQSEKVIFPKLRPRMKTPYWVVCLTCRWRITVRIGRKSSSEEGCSGRKENNVNYKNNGLCHNKKTI